MAKIGDRVRFLNSVGGGIIRRIEGNVAYVDDDGFETPTLLRECVVVAPAEETVRKIAATQEAVSAPEPMTPQKASSAPLPEETPEGGKLNIVLAYEPDDIRHLGTTTYATYLVNDSNYYLYFTYMTREDGAEGWMTRYAGVVEPNIQVFLEDVAPDELPHMDRVALQAVAFKMEREFKLKSPVMVEMPLDTTKFFKLHCFRQSPYFDGDVIALEIVRDDVVRSRAVIDSARLEEGLRAKKRADSRPERRQVTKRPVHPRKGEVIEVDLHIDELLDTTAGMSPADILNRQIDEFRRVMDENLRNRGQKIVFIHGKGEGVLRNAIMKELNHRYKGHQVQDASFREYGFGATQVTI